jgi:hypothetical protein
MSAAGAGDASNATTQRQNRHMCPILVEYQDIIAVTS